MGGCSGLNAMMYVRGNKADYDEWAKLTNDPIWSGKSILKFFKKQEDYHGKFPNCNWEIKRLIYLITEFKKHFDDRYPIKFCFILNVPAELHGEDGEIYVTEMGYLPPVSKYFYEALKERNISVMDVDNIQGIGKCNTIYNSAPERI